MPRERTGSVIERKGVIFARIRYVDESGKPKSVERKADNRSHARRICKDLLRDLESHGEKLIESERLTFEKLADYFEKHYIVAAKYNGDHKISGLRSWQSARGFLQILKDYFGRRLVRAITYGDIKEFRTKRMETPTLRDKALAKTNRTDLAVTRSVASVNRELALLRKMFNVAVAERFIIRNPFSNGEALISVAAENRRERILTPVEEIALLAACEPKQYQHLKPILIAALDTGARQGELFSLCWRNVDFENEALTLRTYKDKNFKDRQVAFTKRLKELLLGLWEKSDKQQETSVFGIKSNVKRSFDAARRKAGLPELRFHDLRHSAATRLVQMQVPLSEVGRILGHSQPGTTYRYMNANIETARRAATALDNFQLLVKDKNAANEGEETVH